MIWMIWYTTIILLYQRDNVENKKYPTNLCTIDYVQAYFSVTVERILLWYNCVHNSTYVICLV